MALKKPPPPEEDPPSFSFSSADDDEQDQQQEQPQPPSAAAGEDSDEDPQQQQQQQQQPKKLPSPAPKPKSSSSKKLEPEPESKTLKVKPLDETKKPKPKTTAAATTTAAAADIRKKKPETKAVNDSKKSRKKKDPEPENETEIEPKPEPELAISDKKSKDTKKLLFQRLWSEEDEIAVLRGVIEFKEEKGVDPAKEMGSFFEFIKGSLHFDVSLAQLKDKVWRLKRKFEKSVKRGSKGEDKTFSKEHDQLGFDLSKRIWGSERIELRGKNSNGNGASVKMGNVGENRKKGSNTSSSNNDRLVKRAKVEKCDFRCDFQVRGGMEEFVRKEGLDLMEGNKRAEMEDRWRELDIAELELFLKRNELVREQAKLMLAAYETEDD